MSAAPKIIEGSWEEIQNHAHEFAGHRLRVVVMDNAESLPPTGRVIDNSPEAVAAWVARRREQASRHVNTQIADDSRDTIYEDFLK